MRIIISSLQSMRWGNVKIAAFIGFLTLIYYIGISHNSEGNEGLDLSPFLEFSLQDEAAVSSVFDLYPPEFKDPEEFRKRQLLSSRGSKTKSPTDTPLRFVVLEEVVGQGEEGFTNNSQLPKMATVTEYSTDHNTMHLVRLHMDIPSIVETSQYVQRSPKSLTLRLGTTASQWQPNSRNLSETAEYFSYLHTPQAHCRKLARLGGVPMCDKVGDDRNMDGNKLVCFDPELELPGGREPTDCLVFSYGVFTDSSFDEAIAILPCEIHMFDIYNYTPSEVLKRHPHSHFHRTGISVNNQANFFSKKNLTILVDTLIGQVVKNDLIGRPMHILKIDIEDAEWDVIKSLKENKFLELIGQIAIEIHAPSLLSMNMKSSQKLKYVQDRYDILRLIENHGFRMVAYWDNHQPNAFYDESGTRHDVCGEMLYVNTNWYNSTFKRTLKENYGFKFRVPT
ncbi:probable methyltransferase-like protein 24 [Palaemon carinicauda]|uniref:probable methyltransferase-like protein 24 n=1 Tax=Palaemon carinicauda TaxID=392227 RepID=UPI0035B5FD78